MNLLEKFPFSTVQSEIGKNTPIFVTSRQLAVMSLGNTSAENQSLSQFTTKCTLIDELLIY